ncbi:MAG TPA: hypothetical protein VMF31_12185 [Solirubrobacterales bacterium]|nr:hypothetical protein [Solirubrobacterales bacterium]
MADSSDDLKREMEEFERGEAGETDSLTAGATEPATSAARRTIPAWVYYLVAIDAVILVVVLFVFVL